LHPFNSGIPAVKLAIASFFIPYIFIYNPILVLVDVTPFKFILAFVTALLGMSAISSSMIGYFARQSRLWERFILFGAGILLIIPNMFSSLAGVIVCGVIWFIQNQRKDDGDKIEKKPSLQA